MEKSTGAEMVRQMINNFYKLNEESFQENVEAFAGTVTKDGGVILTKPIENTIELKPEITLTPVIELKKADNFLEINSSEKSEEIEKDQISFFKDQPSFIDENKKEEISLNFSPIKNEKTFREKIISIEIKLNELSSLYEELQEELDTLSFNNSDASYYIDEIRDTITEALAEIGSKE